MFTVIEYLSLIAGGLAYIISLILIVISLKLKYKSNILPLRIVAVILIVLGSLLVVDAVFGLLNIRIN